MSGVKKSRPAQTAPRQDMPCYRVLDCWFERFAVEDFIREHFTKEQMRAFLAPPAPKLLSLIELVQAAYKQG